jgi:hypothetical protein
MYPTTLLGMGWNIGILTASDIIRVIASMTINPLYPKDTLYLRDWIGIRATMNVNHIYTFTITNNGWCNINNYNSSTWIYDYTDQYVSLAGVTD